MEVGAYPVLDEIAPTMSEVNAAETRYHRIQSASEIFADDGISDKSGFPWNAGTAPQF